MKIWPWRRSATSVASATRREQLQQVVAVADRLRDTFHENAHMNFARAFNDLARDAEALLESGFGQADLNELSSRMPGGPSWLDSRSVDYNGPRAPWQEKVVAAYWDCWRDVLELRIIGTPISNPPGRVR